MDLVVIAPATANLIGKFARGIADDFISTLLLSVKNKVLIAPAMNPRMWSSKPVQKNIEILKTYEHIVMTPGDGLMASSEEDRGVGRMPDPLEILHTSREILGKKQSGLPSFNVADLSFDGDLLEEAKLYAENIINTDPQLENNKNLKDLLYIHERDTAIRTLNAG